jgi:hypothetical protein
MVMHAVIDAESGLPFEHGEAVLSTYSAAAHLYGRWDQRLNRIRLDADGFDKYRVRQDSAFVRNLALQATAGQQGQDRADALTGSAGAFPRDFEHIYNEILTEERRPLNWQSLFRMDGRVPLGARTHTVRRRLGTGDTAVYRGGVEIPVVRGSRVEEDFRVIHLVTSVMVDWFEMLSDSFAGRNSFADDTRDAVRFLEERANTIAFNGDAPSQVFGVFDYPHLSKSVSAVAFTAAAVSADPAGTRAELNRLANFAIENSGGTFRPNRFVTSIRIRNVLMQTKNSVTGGTDTSVGDFWLRGQPDINQIESAHEMRGVGPNGEDGLLFYDDQLQSTAFVLIQPPTALPAHAVTALQNQTVYVMTLGGMVMRNVGNNLLAFGAGVLSTGGASCS